MTGERADKSLPEPRVTPADARSRRHPRRGAPLPHHRRLAGGEEPLLPPRRRLLRRIHRWTGLAAGLFLLLLAITGVLINHAHDWGLDRTPVTWHWLHAWYGLPPPAPPLGAQVQDQLVVWSGGVLAASGQQHALEDFVGAVGTDALWVAAGSREMLLLTPAGELVERIGSAGLPGRLQRIGQRDGTIVVASERGLFATSEAFLGWQPAAAQPPPAWSEPARVPDEVARQLPVTAPGALAWSRVIQDLHSGNLFGIGGRVVADLAAGALIFLLISGLIVWRRTTRRRPINADGS